MFEKRWLVEEWYEGSDFVSDVETWRFRWDDDAMDFVMARCRDLIFGAYYFWCPENEELRDRWRCRVSNTHDGRTQEYDWTTVPLPTKLHWQYEHLIPEELTEGYYL